MGKSAALQEAAPRPDFAEPLDLIVAWQNPDTRTIAPIGRLGHHDGMYTFAYLRSTLTLPGFRPLLGFPDLGKLYSSRRLFPLFRQRLMDTGRPDFASYMDMLGLSSTAPPLNVLARSGGRRLGDSLFLVRSPGVNDDESSRAVFFVHGVRHVQGASEKITELYPGDELLLEAESDNPVNPRALLVTANDSTRLGYVPDLLVDYTQKVCSVSPPKVRVMLRNALDSPPNLRLLVEISGHVPSGYVPFSGDEWDTVADGGPREPTNCNDQAGCERRGVRK